VFVNKIDGLASADPNGQPVVAISTRWVDSLRSFANGGGNLPPSIRAVKFFQSQMRVGADYAIVDPDTFAMMNRRFGCDAYETGTLLRHPATQDAVVSLQPKSMKFVYLGRKEVRKVDAGWKLGDVKCDVCRRMRLDPVRFSVFTSGRSVPVDENQTCAALPTGPLTLKEGGPNVPKLDHPPGVARGSSVRRVAIEVDHGSCDEITGVGWHYGVAVSEGDLTAAP
jgi:hypothetical protein